MNKYTEKEQKACGACELSTKLSLEGLGGSHVALDRVLQKNRPIHLYTMKGDLLDLLHDRMIDRPAVAVYVHTGDIEITADTPL